MFVVTYRTPDQTLLTDVVNGSQLCNMWCDFSLDIVDVEPID